MRFHCTPWLDEPERLFAGNAPRTVQKQSLTSPEGDKLGRLSLDVTCQESFSTRFGTPPCPALPQRREGKGEPMSKSGDDG